MWRCGLLAEWDWTSAFQASFPFHVSSPSMYGNARSSLFGVSFELSVLPFMLTLQTRIVSAFKRKWKSIICTLGWNVYLQLTCNWRESWQGMEWREQGKTTPPQHLVLIVPNLFTETFLVKIQNNNNNNIKVAMMELTGKMLWLPPLKRIFGYI